MGAPRRIAPTALAAIAALCPCALADRPEPAQVGAAADASAGWFETRIARLDSDDLDIREQAQFDLSAAGAVTPRVYFNLLRAGGLSPEQGARLQALAREQFHTGGWAAMGISFGLEDEDGVSIAGFAGGNRFFARDVLEVGDVIRGVGGEALSGNERLRALIISHEPGDEMVLDIVRKGRPMTVTVRLGRYEDLENARSIRGQRYLLEQAWRARVAREMGASPPALIGQNIPVEAWMVALMRPRPGRPQTQGNSGALAALAARVDAGGQPQDGPLRNPGVVVRNPSRVQRPSVQAAPNAADQQRHLDAMNDLIRMLEERLADKTLIDAVRQDLIENRRMLEERIKRMKDEIERGEQPAIVPRNP